jgi:hypothetical protein
VLSSGCAIGESAEARQPQFLCAPPPCEAVDAVLQGAPHRPNAEPRALPLKGAPNASAVFSGPANTGTPVAVVGHGAVLPDVETGADGLEGGITARGVSVVRGANGFVVRATDGGLRPPPPISVEPNGIPTGPTGELDPIPVPDEAIGVDPAKEPPLAAQVPDALPVIPPPSKTAVAVPDAPVIEELPVPADEAPHVVPVLVAGLMGDVPDINGLSAGAASSVEPMGVLVGATGEPGPKPSGDVKPSGGPGEMLIPPICA